MANRRLDKLDGNIDKRAIISFSAVQVRFNRETTRVCMYISVRGAKEEANIKYEVL